MPGSDAPVAVAIALGVSTLLVIDALLARLGLLAAFDKKID